MRNNLPRETASAIPVQGGKLIISSAINQWVVSNKGFRGLWCRHCMQEHTLLAICVSQCECYIIFTWTVVVKLSFPLSVWDFWGTKPSQTTCLLSNQTKPNRSHYEKTLLRNAEWITGVYAGVQRSQTPLLVSKSRRLLLWLTYTPWWLKIYGTWRRCNI